jgi:hypothetical protein
MVKYKVNKHPYLPIAIARFFDKTVIMPAGIECDPETTLDDIIVIETDIEPKKIEPTLNKEKTWEFKSSSSDGLYVVKENMGKLKCNCPGTWRARDRRCKHIKEVEKELGLVK